MFKKQLIGCLYSLQYYLWLGFLLCFGTLSNNSKLSTYFYVGVLLPALLIFAFSKAWRDRFMVPALLLPIFLLPLLLAVSNFWTADKAFYEPMFFLKQVLFLAFFFFSVLVATGYKSFTPTRFLKVVLLSGLINALYNLWLYYGDGWRGVLEGYTLVSNPNPLASFHAITLLVAVFLASESKLLWQRVLYVACVLPSLLIIVLSDAKLPLLCLWLGTIFFLPKMYFTKLNLQLLVFGSAALLMLVCFIPKEYLADIYGGHGFLSSFLARADIWREAMTVISNNWVLGLGIARELPMSNWPYSHNLFIESFRIAGFAAFFSAFFLVFKVVTWLYTQIQYSTVGRLLLVWFLVGFWASMYYGSQPLVRPDDRWFIFWLPIALIAAGQSKGRLGARGRSG